VTEPTFTAQPLRLPDPDPAEAGPAASADQPTGLLVYLVTLDTPKGRAELEVPTTLGPDAAGRRAWMTALQLRWGDVDEITVVSAELITGRPR
jgi:hypothetical protein